MSSSINNNKYLQYHTPCRKLKINMHKYICATTAVPLLRLGRSGSDPESGRKCSSTSYTDFRFYKVTRQHFKTISNNYISDDTVLQKYCMLCQRLQAVNELLLPFHMKCIHRVLVYSELFWHIAHNRLYLYQHITHCLITAVCFWSATLHCSLYHHLQVGPLLLNFALTSVLRLIIWPPQ